MISEESTTRSSTNKEEARRWDVSPTAFVALLPFFIRRPSSLFGIAYGGLLRIRGVSSHIVCYLT